jgi:regulatory protein
VPPEIVDQVMAERAEEQEEEEELFQSDIGGEARGDEEVAPGSDLANALGLARKRMRSLSGLEPQVAQRRLFAFLSRRGYDYDTISDVMRRVLAEEEEGDE